MKHKSKALFSLAITASILSTLLPSSTYAMMNKSEENNNHNSCNPKNEQHIHHFHFENSDHKHYFLTLLGEDSAADVIRLFREQYDLNVCHLWTKTSMIPDNTKIKDIYEQHGDHIYLAHPSLIDAYQTETDSKDFQSGGFVSQISEHLLLPNSATNSAQQKPIKKDSTQQKSTASPLEDTLSVDVLTTFNPKIVKEVVKLLNNPNDKQELVRRLNNLKLVSLISDKKEVVDTVKEIGKIESELIPEQKNICLQLRDSYGVSYFTAVQIFVLCGCNEFKARKLLQTMEPEPCF